MSHQIIFEFAAGLLMSISISAMDKGIAAFYEGNTEKKCF